MLDRIAKKVLLAGDRALRSLAPWDFCFGELPCCIYAETVCSVRNIDTGFEHFPQ